MIIKYRPNYNEYVVYRGKSYNERVTLYSTKLWDNVIVNYAHSQYYDYDIKAYARVLGNILERSITSSMYCRVLVQHRGAIRLELSLNYAPNCTVWINRDNKTISYTSTSDGLDYWATYINNIYRNIFKASHSAIEHKNNWVKVL